MIVEQPTQIPSLPQLALQYGTISNEQYAQLNQAYELKKEEDPALCFDHLLISLKFITGQQVDLLKLIQEYLLVKQQGEAFGKLAIEKGLATGEEVDKALDHQKKEFKRTKVRKRIGNILVEMGCLTEAQKNLILKEQALIKGDDDRLTESLVHVSISRDQMNAVVKIGKDVETVTLQEIKHALEAGKISCGIYPDALLQCNLDMKNTEFIAARPEFSFEWIKTRKALYHFDTGKIDSKVKDKGETLVEQHLGGATYFRKDLFGRNVKQTGGEGLVFRCADGTRLSTDKTKAFAAKTGFPSLSIERKLYVHPKINVLEDADLRYGPLENYANLNISGELTGAYPVTAGEITAREIRGARIDAIGCVRSQIGITDSVISTQGDVHARYLHHCRIETFGNVYIENEIIDSQIFCSGKIDSGRCRVLASTLYGKKGIELAGAGNRKTNACVLGAGTEHHILEKAGRINREIKNISRQLDALKEKKAEQDRYSNKILKKMGVLKNFYRHAKTKKEIIAKDFKIRKASFEKEELKNIVGLIKNLEKKLASSAASLKELNETKKKFEKEKALVDEKIKQIQPKIKREISELEMDLFAFFEWTRKQENIAQIKINETAFAGTIFKGVFSSLEIKKDLNAFSVVEKHLPSKKIQMVVQKN